MIQLTNGPFGKELDPIAQTYKDLQDSKKAEEAKIEPTKPVKEETIKEAAQNRFFTQLAAKAAFGKQGVENLNAGKCPMCGGEAINFADEKSRREHEISGLCQSCQNKSFQEEETVNEISSQTLKNYRNKAHKDAAKKLAAADKLSKPYSKSQRSLNRMPISDRLESNRLIRKAGQRNTGIAQANERLSGKYTPKGSVKYHAEETQLDEAGSIKTMWTDKQRMTPGEIDSYAQQDDRAFDRNFPGVRQADSDWDEAARKNRRRRRKPSDPNYDTTKERDMDLKDETINEVSFDKLDRYMEKGRQWMKTYAPSEVSVDASIYGDSKREQGEGAALEKWVERGRQNRRKGIMLAYNKQKIRARVPASYGEEDRVRKEETVNEINMKNIVDNTRLNYEANFAKRNAKAIWPDYDVEEPKPGVTIRSTTVPKEKVADYGKDVVAKGLAAGKALAASYKKHKADYMAQWKKKHHSE